MAIQLLESAGYSRSKSQFLIDQKCETIEPFECTARWILQTLGTEWGRRYIREDIWVRLAEQFIIKTFGEVSVVIDDVRFENEADFVRSKGGLIIHLKRGDQDPDRWHASEEGIKVHQTDAVILNNSTPNELWRSVDQAVSNHYDPDRELIRLCNTPCWLYEVA